ncbi:hypothetical protein [Halopiger djelfimassiliensis]|uniref:hypothetical protein n=1 Tax=Halopiger djelfimassiliensis TaxID=1293047 RepID=UPI000677D891|nr:hypothetical protein [Halopiger djelfimassiliensis]
MGRRTDAALAGIVLVAAGIAFGFVETSFAPIPGALGGLGTVAFELLAARDPDAVRRYWDRPAVQIVAAVAALSLVAVGALVAPATVLSAVCGALVTYLCVLLVGTVRRKNR